MNALLAGEVDAIDQMAFASARQYRETAAFQLIETKSGNIRFRRQLRPGTRQSPVGLWY